MIKRLRFKFILINMTIVSVMLVIILGLVFYFTSANLESESIRMMEQIAIQPIYQGLPNEQEEHVRLPFFTLQLGPEGELISSGGGFYDLSDQDFLEELIRKTFSSSHRLGVIEEYNLRYYRADTPLRQCLVFADISSERATLHNLVKNCVLIGCLSFLLFLGVSILLSKWAVRPVEQAWRQQRQFVADASHELKTPLTVIMTNAELARNPGSPAPDRERFLDGILTMSRQMRRLVEQMLELARTDQAETQGDFHPVAWGKLVSDALLPFEPIFFEAGLTLTSTVDREVRVQGDEARLRQVVEILLDNAQKYAKPGGRVWVTLARQGRGRCVLAVADEGAPIPPEALGQLFKRFYRADPARSRTGSFGLGLAIAQGVVTQHRGRIWAESRDGINTFSVELPCL